MNMLAAGPEPDWDELSKEWEKSGVSQRKFCEQRGLLYTRFCHRRGQLLKSGEALSRQRGGPRKPSVAGFLPVTVEAEENQPKTSLASSPVSPVPEIEVELPFGVVLRFRGIGQR